MSKPKKWVFIENYEVIVAKNGNILVKFSGTKEDYALSFHPNYLAKLVEVAKQKKAEPKAS